MIKSITSIFARALAKAKESKDANYIRISYVDRHTIKLMTHVNGVDAAWINYNADQADELIRLLQSHREDIE